MSIIISEPFKWVGQNENDINSYMVSIDDIGFFKKDGSNYQLNSKDINFNKLLEYLSGLETRISSIETYLNSYNNNLNLNNYSSNYNNIKEDILDKKWEYNF